MIRASRLASICAMPLLLAACKDDGGYEKISGKWLVTPKSAKAIECGLQEGIEFTEKTVTIAGQLLPAKYEREGERTLVTLSGPTGNTVMALAVAGEYLKVAAPFNCEYARAATIDRDTVAALAGKWSGGSRESLEIEGDALKMIVGGRANPATLSFKKSEVKGGVVSYVFVSVSGVPEAEKAKGEQEMKAVVVKVKPAGEDAISVVAEENGKAKGKPDVFKRQR